MNGFCNIAFASHQLFLSVFSVLNHLIRRLSESFGATVKVSVVALQLQGWDSNGGGGELLGEQTTSEDLYDVGAAALIRSYYGV